MYAIIRVGGKQAKVRPGDIIDVERVKSGDEQVSYVPLLVVDEEGNAITDRDKLAKMSVTAKVLGESRGPKVDIFKYKNKTGYRRRQGHRQTYTTIEVTGIETPKKATKAAKEKKVEAPAKAAKVEAPAKAAKVEAPAKAAKVEAPAKAAKVEAPAKAAKAKKVETPEEVETPKKAEEALPEES